MNNYKSFSDLKEELGNNYDFKLYEMGISALKEIENLQQENKQLKIQISAREEVCNRLESNWNKLKKWLEKELGDRINPNKDKWLTGVYDAYRETIDKMQELEGSDE